MDATLAAALIHPLQAGDVTAYGWRLASVQVVYADRPNRVNRAVYTFSEPDLQVSVRARSKGGGSAGQTEHFLISFVNRQDELDQRGWHGFRKFVALIETNEAQVDLSALDGASVAPQAPDSVFAIPEQSTGTLFLVPGHIGNLYDISHRAVRTLRDARIIWTEHGDLAGLRDIDNAFDIQLDTKTLYATKSWGASQLALIDQTLANGEDACLFGAGEGLPTICDPGWQLVQAYQVRDRPIRTLAGGGALSTALMRCAESKPFSFWGIMVSSQGASPFMDYLEVMAGENYPNRTVPAAISYSKRDMLIDAWPRLCELLERHRGRIRLMVDVSRPSEIEHTMHLHAMRSFDPEVLPVLAKLVVMVQFERVPEAQKPPPQSAARPVPPPKPKSRRSQLASRLRSWLG